jgi:hypothetical protein
MQILIKMKTIVLKDIVTGTSTNVEAVPAFLKLDTIISKNERVIVSFNGINSVSSSFLNSLFGELIDKYGYERVVNSFEIKNCTKFNAKLLRDYFIKYKTYIH